MMGVRSRPRAENSRHAIATWSITASVAQGPRFTQIPIAEAERCGLSERKNAGIVYLVGAGPGDPGLLTVRGQRLLERADVVIYDYLANPELLNHCRADVERIYVGKKAAAHSMTQDQINALLVSHGQAGK